MVLPHSELAVYPQSAVVVPQSSVAVLHPVVDPCILQRHERTQSAKRLRHLAGIVAIVLRTIGCIDRNRDAELPVQTADDRTLNVARSVASDLPADEYDSFPVEIVSKGNEVWNYLNGTLLSHVSQHDFPSSGYIGFQAESGPMQYRNIRIKPE